MAILFNCPICASEFVAPAEFAGRQARCGGCGNVVDVPQVSQLTGVAGVEQRSSPAAGVSFHSPPATPSIAPAIQNKTALWIGAGVIALGLILFGVLCGGFYLIGLDDGGMPPDHPLNRPIAPQLHVGPNLREPIAAPPPAWSLQADPPEDSSLAVTKVEPSAILPERLSFSRQPGHYAIAEERGEGAGERFRVYDLTTGKPHGDGVVVSQELARRAHLRDLSPSGAFFVAAEKDIVPPTMHVFLPLEGKLQRTITLGDAAEENFGFAIAGFRQLVTAHADERGELTLELYDLIQSDAKLMAIRHVPANSERFDLATLATSPGGRYAAVLTQFADRLLVWDLHSGKLVGDRAYSGGGLWPALAFSPDGKRLARLCKAEPGYQLSVIDLATGETRPGQAFSGGLKGNQIAYAGPRLEWSASGKHLLFCGQDLIDAVTGKLVDAIRHDDVATSHAWCRLFDDDLVLLQRSGTGANRSYRPTSLAGRLASTVAPSTTPPTSPDTDLAAAAPQSTDPDPPHPDEPTGPKADPASAEPVEPAATRGVDPSDSPWERPAIAWTAEVDPPAELPTELTGKIRIPCPWQTAKVVLPHSYRPFAAIYQYDSRRTKIVQIKAYDLRTGEPIGKPVDELYESNNPLAHPELSPDGKLLVVRSGREKPLTYAVFSLTEGRSIANLVMGEAVQYGAVVRFLDERRVFTTFREGRGDSWAAIWDAERGTSINQVQLELSRHYHVDSLALSPGGKFAAIREFGGRHLGIWRLDDGKLVGTYDAADKGTSSGKVAFSPDGKQLAMIDDVVGSEATGQDGHYRVIVLDVATGKATLDVRYRPALVNFFTRSRSLEWSPDQKWLLCAQEDVLDAATGKWVARLDLGKETTDKGAARIVSPDQILHVTGKSRDFSVATDTLKSVWQPPKQVLALVPNPARPPVATVIKPDPPAIAATPDKPATPPDPGPFSVPPAAMVRATPSAREPVWSLALDPPAVAPTFKAGKISLQFENFDEILFPHGPSRFCLIRRTWASERRHQVFDLSTGKPIGKELNEPELRWSSPVLSSDGRYLADFFPGHRQIAVWSFATGKQSCQLPETKGSFDEYVFAGPHQLAVVDSEDLKLQMAVWDVRTGKQIARATIHDDSAAGSSLFLAPSPGGKYVAVVADHELLIVDVATLAVVGRRSMKYLGDRSAIQLFGAWIDLSHVECDGVAWSATGDRLALTLRSGNDGFLVCLDAANGGVLFERQLRNAELGDFKFRDEDANPLDWLPDGSAILVGGTRLYDSRTGKDLYTLATDPTGDDNPRRIIRPWDVLTVAEGADGEDYLVTLPLPKEALAKALEQTGGTGEAVDALLPPLTVASLTGVKTINLGLPVSAWQSLADGVDPGADLPDRVEITAGDRRINRVRFASPASGKLAVVSARQESDGRGNTTSLLQIQQVDARAKKRGPAIEIASKYELADVSPDGQLALLRLTDAPLRHERLDLIGLDPKKHVAGWRPYAGVDATDAARSEGKPKNIHWAGLVDAEHALSLSEAGRLVLWKLPECQAVWQLSGVSHTDGIVLSPGRRFLSLRSGRKLVLLESLTGKVMAQPDLPSDAFIGRIAFRPDGRELYVTYMIPRQPPQVRRLDAATGNVLDDFPLALLGTNSFVQTEGSIFRNDGTALLNGEMLVDLNRQALLWRYVLATSCRLAECSPDGRVWYCNDYYSNQPTELMAVDPLREEVRAATRDLATADQYVLKKGDRIRLAVNLDGAGLAASAPTVEAAIRKRLESGGLVVDSSAKIMLSVVGSERVETKSFKRSSGQVVSVPDMRIAVRFAISDAAGRIFWGHEVVNPPVIDLSQRLEGQLEGDFVAKKRDSVAAILQNPDLVGSIPISLTKDPREILPGESLLGTSGPEALPADKRLPPRPTGLERAAP